MTNAGEGSTGFAKQLGCCCNLIPLLFPILLFNSSFSRFDFVGLHLFSFFAVAPTQTDTSAREKRQTVEDGLAFACRSL